MHKFFIALYSILANDLYQPLKETLFEEFKSFLYSWARSLNKNYFDNPEILES